MWKLNDERQTLLLMQVVVYFTFFLWFGGYPRYGEPLSEVERERYGKIFKGAGWSDEVSPGDIDKFIEQDNGEPFLLTTFSELREEVDYASKLPEGFAAAADVSAAVSAFYDGFLRTALPYATAPIVYSQYTGHVYRAAAAKLKEFDDDDEDEEDEPILRRGDDASDTEAWSHMSVLRFRTRRDFLEVMIAAEEKDLFHHKSASVARISAIVSSASSSPFPMISVDLACNCLVIFSMFVALLLSGLVFPDEEPKKKKKSKKSSKDKDANDEDTKDGKEKKSKSTASSRANSVEPAATSK